MANDRNDDRWGDDTADAPLDPTTLRLAREKVKLPARLLLAAAIFMIFFAILSIGLAFSGQDLNVQMLEFVEQQQPPGKARDDMAKEVEKARTRDKTVEHVQTAVFSVIGLTLDVLVLVGALRMQSLRGRTLAMVGAICAIIPINSCCCVGMPIGIWALIVLMNADVKAAFDTTVQLGSSPAGPMDDDLR